MGVTIGNRSRSIDMGSGGYLRLRKKIAELLNCQEFTDIYFELMDSLHPWKGTKFATAEEYYDDYDKRAVEICEKHKLDEDVINFLYSSDCNATISAKACRHLWKVIKDYDDNIVYGYPGRPPMARAMFKDFKEIVEECAKNRWVMKIY